MINMTRAWNKEKSFNHCSIRKEQVNTTEGKPLELLRKDPYQCTGVRRSTQQKRQGYNKSATRQKKTTGDLNRRGRKKDISFTKHC